MSLDEVRQQSNENRNALETHERVCAERYANINSAIADIKGILKWAGTTLFGLIVATLAWSVSQQFAANESQKAALAAKIELLESRRP